MKRKIVIVTFFLVLLAVIACVAYFFRSGGETINKEITENSVTAKQLVDIAKPYVDEYWKNRNYQVGKISMTLDKNLEGKVEIWYKDDRKNKKGIPNIITVEIDTKEKKILRIINQVKDTKVVPGTINILNWNIDCDRAVEIAKDAFKKDADFAFTFAYLSGTDLFRDGKETWDIALYNETDKKEYHAKVDVYTGEIYTIESK